MSIFWSCYRCLSLENICHGFLMLHRSRMTLECKYYKYNILLYLIWLIWRIKKYDWSREVTWRENKSSCFPPDVVLPCRVSRHNALRCITSCCSFRYNKQLIAQLVGRHEDLSHPENSCHPQATWIIFWVGQIFVFPSKLGNKCI